MSICWYCHWGWAKPVAEIYKKAVEKLDGNDWPLKFGPSHVVWEDENFDLAEWCLENFDRYKDDYSEAELTIIRWSLEELAKLPLEIRDAWPEDYDGEHPENYPPQVEVERI